MRVLPNLLISQRLRLKPRDGEVYLISDQLVTVQRQYLLPARDQNRKTRLEECQLHFPLFQEPPDCAGPFSEKDAVCFYLLTGFEIVSYNDNS